MRSVYLMGCCGVLVGATAIGADVVDATGGDAALVAEMRQASPIAQREIDVSIKSGTILATREQIASRTGIERPQHVMAWSQEIEIPDAGWVRLRFGEVFLAPGSDDARESYLRVTSLADGYEQYLDADALTKWRNTSAYFNGGAVLVELMVSPTLGAVASDVEIRSVMASEPTVFDRSLCGIDDRALSGDVREARIMPIGCTGWLFGDQGSCMLTAGHCNMGSGGDVIQFNVPLSNAGGTPQSPPPQDQYPVDPASIQDVSPSLGNDYAFFGVFNNTDTGLTPLAAQGDSYELATSLPPLDGRSIRITGYGSTTSPVPASWYLAQKTHNGPLFNYSGNVVQYTVDTSGGNSGGSVLDEVNQNVIAIHTNAGCDSVGGNQGCSIMNPGLQNVLANPIGICQPRGLEISPTLGTPEPLDPAGGQVIGVLVTADNGLTPSGEVTMYVDTGFGFVGTPMAGQGDDFYLGIFPAADCPSTIHYYFEALDTDGGAWAFPFGGASDPISSLVAVGQTIAESDSFESDLGWVAGGSNISTGDWERGVPGDFGRSDPPSDFDGSGQCYVTGNTLNEDIDGGPMILTSPVYDLMGIESPTVQYARWYETNSSDEFLVVEFSDDAGGSWVEVESVTTFNNWVEVSIPVEDHVAVTDQFVVRFTVVDEPNNSISEAGVDAFAIVSTICSSACDADLSGDGALDIADILAFIDLFNAGDATADFEPDGVFNIFDMLAFLDAFNAGCP